MSNKIDKICVFCVHFNLSTGASDTFAESSGDMYCGKKHFGGKDYFPSYEEDDLRSVIFKAVTCSDYEQVKL